MKKNKILFLVFTSIIIRIIIAFLYHHSDADTIFYWGKYLWEKKDFIGFLGKEVPNAMPAVYPPLFYYILFIWRGFYFFIKDTIWFLNVNFSIFPSNIISWFESYEASVGFIKIIAITADFGCAFLLYKISLLVSRNEKLSIGSALFFLFFPASWYLSSYWGQVDSVWGFFILLSVYALLRNKFFWAVFYAGISFLFKQTGVLIFPLILFYCFRKKKLLETVPALLLLLILTFTAYLPFFPHHTLLLAMYMYFKSFQGEINYLVANAFNLWALFFGFEPKPVNVLFFGLPVVWSGYFLFVLTGFLIFKKLWSSLTKMNFLTAVFLFSQGAFLFLPRMHERYFYLAYLILPVLMMISKKTKIWYVILSMIFLLNLYHYWWHPKIPFLIALLSSMTVVRGIIIINICIFLYLLIIFLKDGTFYYHRQL